MRTTLRVLLFAIPLSLIAPIANAAAPAAPTAVTVTSASLANALITGTTGAKAEVSWASAVTGALGYVITATASGQTTVTKTITPGSLTSTILEGLDGGISYSFVVASKNADGETPASGVTFVTRSVPAVPTLAAGTSVAPGKNQVTLSWTAPTNSGGVELTGFTISATGVESVTAGPESTTALIVGLNNGADYNFTIQAVNSIGSSTAAPFATAAIPDFPGAPTALAAGPPVASTISATWAAPADNGGSAVTSYTAYLYDSQNNEVTAQRKSNLTTADAEFTALAAGTYTVKVSATNLVGEGEKTSASSPQVVSATSALTANTPVISPATINDLPIDSTFVLTATAPSAGAVALAVSPSSVCRIETATGVVTGVSAGTCSITATIAQSGQYEAGNAPTKNFNVVKVTQTINFPTITPREGSGQVVISATSLSGVPVTFTASGNCTVSSSTVTFTVGSCTIRATASATTRYAAATRDNTFAISPAQPVGDVIVGGASTPVLTPSPSPTASASPSPTASASPSPTASPTTGASASPKPSASASASPKPSASAGPVVLKANTYVAVATSKTPTTNLSLTTSSKVLSVKAGKAIAVSLPTVAKGTTVVTSLKMPNGKTVQVSSIKTTKTGKFTIPSLLLKKPGTYTLQIKIGKITKTVKVTVKK